MATQSESSAAWLPAIDALLRAVCQTIEDHERALFGLNAGADADNLRRILERQVDHLASLHALRLVAGSSSPQGSAMEVRSRLRTLAAAVTADRARYQQWCRAHEGADGLPRIPPARGVRRTA